MYHTPYKPLYQLLVLSITFPCFLCSAPNKAIPSYHNCKQTFECGDPSVIGDLKFPFWGVNRASYCGLSGFEIECINNTPTLQNSTYNLSVIGTDPQDGKITVSIPDFSNTLCPSLVFSRKLADFSFIDLGSGSLYMDQGNSYKVLTILYGCPSELGRQLSWSNEPSCTTNTSIDVHFVTDTVNSSITSRCAYAVALPILQVNAQVLDDNKSSLVSVLDQGFEMKWFILHEKECKSCTESSGECGFDWSKNQSVCYCPDNTVSLVCSQTIKGSKHKKSFAIGVSVGVVALLLSLLAGGWIVLARRRRSQLVASQKARGIHPSISNGEGGVGGFKGSNGLTSSQGYTTSSTLSQTTPSYTSSVSDVARDKTCYFGVHVFDYTELEHATCNFDDSKELGDGGFGTVYYGVLPDGRQVAVKRLYENSFKRVEQFMNEIRILAELHHKNLVALYGCTSRRSRELLLVYEYISNGTVADHIHGKLADTTFVPWHTRLSIAIETAEALSFLHRNDVIHRDVKTTNILLDNQFHVKVADFGLSRLFPTDMTHVSTAPQGTPGYVDPDYYICYKLTEKSDVYSFGVVLIELISSKHAVDITRHRHHVNLANMALDWIQSQEIHKLVDPRLRFDKDESIKAMVNMVGELGFRCLQQDRDMRPTMDEVMASLRAIQLEGLKGHKQEVVDIIVYGDDVGLLTNPTPPLSPELPRSNDVV